MSGARFAPGSRLLPWAFTIIALGLLGRWFVERYAREPHDEATLDTAISVGPPIVDGQAWLV